MRAIGLAAMIVVLGVFMPKVLAAIQIFLLQFFQTATVLMQNVQHPSF
ncbi:MAG: hypothetical protein UX72_C0003G0061 [Parcubacteria group bacterium GW2011_GWA2_47_10]|nr:MAG: hypothetical protein UX72_C0003G0061 [Parcubacteria group bacterium GW2011_GWA2_47_10]